jgi:hypothetical protein
LLDLPRNKPHHSCFGQLVDKDGTVLLCVHEWGVEDHPPLSDPKADKPGNGLLLFFRADNFETALAAARGLGTLEQAPSRNENTGTMEFSLRDLTAISSRSARMTEDKAIARGSLAQCRKEPRAELLVPACSRRIRAPR